MALLFAATVLALGGCGDAPSLTAPDVESRIDVASPELVAEHTGVDVRAG